MEFYGSTVTGEVRGYTWNPRSGYQQVVVYTGTSTELDTIASNAISNGYSVRYVPDSNGGYGSVEVTYGAAETQDPAVALSDEWSLEGNDLEKSIYEHANFIALTEGWSSEHKLLFKNVCEAAARGEGETQSDAFVRLSAAKGEDVVYQKVKVVYDELAKGVEAYTVSQFVLRHTVVITANSSIKPVMDNVGRIFKTGNPDPILDSVSGAEVSVPDISNDQITIPDTLKFNLPAGYWLKRTPTVTQNGTDKWTVTQEYWHADSYSTFLYEPAS